MVVATHPTLSGDARRCVRVGYGVAFAGDALRSLDHGSVEQTVTGMSAAEDSYAQRRRSSESRRSGLGPVPRPVEPSRKPNDYRSPRARRADRAVVVVRSPVAERHAVAARRLTTSCRPQLLTGRCLHGPAITPCCPQVRRPAPGRSVGRPRGRCCWRAGPSARFAPCRAPLCSPPWRCPSPRAATSTRATPRRCRSLCGRPSSRTTVSPPSSPRRSTCSHTQGCSM